MINIIYKDEYIVVCLKPCGILSTDEPGGMPELIRKQLGLNNKSVFTVHRLDQVVSGLMIYALTSEIASILSSQITDGTFIKKYLAVVHGVPTDSDGLMEDLLFRDSSKNMTYVVNRMRKGVKKASLEYSVKQSINNLSLVKIKLITGRTHQIRAQFSSRKMPLVGDRKYGAASDNCSIALWSHSLVFNHPISKEKLEFDILPPNQYPWSCFDGYTSDICNSDVYGRKCEYSSKCEACTLINNSYSESLAVKQKKLDSLLGAFCHLDTIVGMDFPYNYRGKVLAAFGYDKNRKIVSGLYKNSSHTIVPIDYCLLEDTIADEIILTIKKLLIKYKIEPYDDRKNKGFLRYALVRRSSSTGQAMVILVSSSEIFKAQKLFVKDLIDFHPEIKTVVLNINYRFTSVVLGSKYRVLYGPGYISDVLLGLKFRISPSAFYQINNRQTEVLYKKVLEFANFSGNETLLDAYCGTGTIGLCASQYVKQVIGVELNRDSVKDAIYNAKANSIVNCRFVCDDSGSYMKSCRSKGIFDTVIIDPPRSGCDSTSINSMLYMEPQKIIYVSCNPNTLATDLTEFKKKYDIIRIQGIDMFPFTEHVETVVLMSKTGR